MTNYLKKTKMYQMAKELVPSISKMIDCHYKFYRGSEWLSFSDENYVCYCMYHCGAHVSVDSYDYDEFDNRIELDRICYVLTNGNLVETYRRVS